MWREYEALQIIAYWHHSEGENVTLNFSRRHRQTSVDSLFYFIRVHNPITLSQVLRTEKMNATLSQI
jgi:hypothetical protein